MDTPGIAVNFFAAIVGAILNIALIHLKPALGIESVEYELTFILLITLMVVRHHCRVVFIDSATASYIPQGQMKRALRLLFVLVIIGSGLLVYFAYNMVVGAMAALLYSVLFFIFWLILILGAQSARGTVPQKDKKQIQRRFHNASFGFVVDLVILIWWINWTWSVLATNQTELSDGNTFFTTIVAIIITAEVVIVYREHVLERWRLVTKHLV